MSNVHSAVFRDPSTIAVWIRVPLSKQTGIGRTYGRQISEAVYKVHNDQTGLGPHFPSNKLALDKEESKKPRRWKIDAFGWRPVLKEC